MAKHKRMPDNGSFSRMMNVQELLIPKITEVIIHWKYKNMCSESDAFFLNKEKERVDFFPSEVLRVKATLFSVGCFNKNISCSSNGLMSQCPKPSCPTSIFQAAQKMDPLSFLRIPEQRLGHCCCGIWWITVAFNSNMNVPQETDERLLILCYCQKRTCRFRSKALANSATESQFAPTINRTSSWPVDSSPLMQSIAWTHEDPGTPRSKTITSRSKTIFKCSWRPRHIKEPAMFKCPWRPRHIKQQD